MIFNIQQFKIFPLAAMLGCALATAAPTPPAQPASGPGGSDYRHAKVVATAHGKGATGYWLYEPAEPVPQSAPLVVFNHGWLAYRPGAYRAWTEHLVKRGNIVVYPLYQDSPFTRGEQFTPNAIRAVKDAILELQTGHHVRPELDKFAIVGHSAGGVITADMAVRAGAEGLPVPKALMIVEPGRGELGGRPGLPVEDYTKIPSNALLLVVIGATYPARPEIWPAAAIYRQAPLPAANKNFITVPTDRHGQPELISDHLSACGEYHGSRWSPKVDALDYYGHWKPFDALCDAAFYGRNRDMALGNTPQQRFMGRWSDGVPVNELIVAEPPK
jgi:pimeloyl-ACP methyl ester carboxylesterase